MGKWLFLTFLLAIFSGLSAGGNAVPVAGKSVSGVARMPVEKAPLFAVAHAALPVAGDWESTPASLNSLSSRTASFSNAQRPVPFPRLLSGHLVLPEAATHTGWSNLLIPHLQLNIVARCYEGYKRKQRAPVEPVLKDHFHHLFPFFHFW